MAAGLAGLILLLFAGLLPLGHWYSDEYDIFHDMALHGGSAAWHRFWYWSPRPVSEGLIYLYGRIVLATGQAWILGILLAPLLLLLAAATLPLYRASIRSERSWILLTVVVCALCLAGHAVARVFYWPVAALAYVTTLAGIMGLFAESLRKDFAARPWAGGGWLLLTALSSEIGAMFALAYGLLGLCWTRHRFKALLPAMLGAGLVLLLILSHRVEVVSEQISGIAKVHDLPGSLKASLLAAWPNLWFSALTVGSAGAALQVLSKLALIVGAAGLAVGQQLPASGRRPLLLLAVAAAAMVPATIFAAYYQFGQLCCEHHDTVRQCIMMVSLAALGVVLASSLPRNAWTGQLHRSAPWILCVALLAALLVSARPLWADYREYAWRYQLQQENWRSGEVASSVLRVRQQAPARLTGGPAVVPAGTFGDGIAVPASVAHQLHFFGKRVAWVEPAELMAAR